MNLFLIQKKDFRDDQHAVLRGRAFIHARDILKVKKGQAVQVGLLNGMMGSAEVVEISEDSFTLGVRLYQEPPEKMDMTLILSLPRPPVFRRVLSAVTAMGVKKVVLIQSARGEKSYWNSPALKEENVRQLLMLGLEQARDTLLPEVSFEKNFRFFVENSLPKIIEGKKCVLAHPDEAQPCPCSLREPLVLVVGPEGGFVDTEVEKFKKMGFTAVHLGQRILRVETAVQALIGRLMAVQ